MNIIAILLAITLSSSAFSSYLRLPPKKEQAIKQDAPIEHFHWDPQTKIMWLIGSKSLWRWNTSNNKLQKVRHPIIKVKTFVSHTDDYIWISTKNRLVGIDKAELKEVTHSIEIGGEIYGLHEWGNKLIINTNHAVISVNPADLSQYEKKPRQISRPSYFGGRFLWSYEKGLQITDKHGTSKPILKCSTGKDKPAFTQNSVIYFCKNKFYRFSMNGKLIQVIPNLGATKISAWSFDDLTHSFQFQNKVLEVFDLKSENRQTFLLHHKLDKLEVHGSIIAGLSNNIPVLEVLPTP